MHEGVVRGEEVKRGCPRCRCGGYFMLCRVWNGACWEVSWNELIEEGSFLRATRACTSICLIRSCSERCGGSNKIREWEIWIALHVIILWCGNSFAQMQM